MTGQALCRDCLARQPAGRRCRRCAGPRLICHAELDTLAIAHLDCDAFFAAVEKRDRPELLDKPVAIGGSARGVVMTACYVARAYGIGSAMPMFKALKACPDLIVIKPDMAKYRALSAELRQRMQALTPLVEPVSIDEAFLDLSGTARLHRGSPAEALSALQSRIEQDFGVTVSIGLSHNKFLAKLACGLSKPRGFTVLGQAETQSVLDPLSVTTLPGVGRALAAKLARDGVATVQHLRGWDEAALIRRHGQIGRRLYQLARGLDARPVTPGRLPKSVSSETTLEQDEADIECLERLLWQQCERLSQSLKRKDLAGATVHLKLKTARFQLLTRAQRLSGPTQLADQLFKACRPLLAAETGPGRLYRLIGIGVSDLVPGSQADLPDLADPGRARRAQAEHAMDLLRARFGDTAIIKGRSLEP
ncbi:MAG: DNA polymerase IV [Rhodothalassiaceae bacterium]